MNILRKIVSGKKNRFEEDGYNLDLTYITPRIIAMSLPGMGVQKIYRNSIDSVSEFLNKKHHGNYRIFNLSGIKYDYDKFGGSVKEYPWENHNPPPIELLFEACNEIHKWLDLHENNVVAINCLAGKGRTGTLICCYLLYSGRLCDPSQAMFYYKNKRFYEGGGVTQPSQIRYIYYFAQVLNEGIRSPNILQLKSVRIQTAPHYSNDSCRPVFELQQQNRLVFSNKKNTRDRQPVIIDNWGNVQVHEIVSVNSEFLLQGDTHCFLYHWGTLNLKKICRFSFSTAFSSPGTTIIFNKQEVDPDKFKDNKQVSEDFSIFIEFDKKKCDCLSTLLISQRCEICNSTLEFNEKQKWVNIQHILLERVRSNPSIMLFGHEPDDIDEVLNAEYRGVG